MRVDFKVVRFSFFALLIFARSLGAQESSELAKIFPKEADLFVEKSGLQRLELPAEVLAASKGDLSDLRIFDAKGKEVPFLVENVLFPLQKNPPKKIEVKILNVHREEVPHERGPSVFRESYEVELPETPSGDLSLVFQTTKNDFVRKIQVEGEGPEAEKAKLVEQGSIFRLSQFAAEKLKIPLPPFQGQRLWIHFEGEGGYLEPQLELEGEEKGKSYQPAELVMELKELLREDLQGKSSLEFVRPLGWVPDRIRMESNTSFFHREVKLFDQGPQSPLARVGEAVLFRLEGPAPVEQMELKITPVRGNRLRVEIQNGDSPPLEGLKFWAVIRQPSILFSLQAAPSGRASGILRFGGGRAHRPQYDLAGFSQKGTEGLQPLQNALLMVSPDVDLARLGSIRDNPTYTREPALGFAMKPGASLDPRLYRHRRFIRVPSSQEGLVRLVLEPEDRVVAQEDLDDVRLVDGNSRQWPYLLKRSAEEKEISLKMESQSQRGTGPSRYRILLPVSPLWLEGITLQTTVPFFNRSFQLVSQPGKINEKILAQGNLVRSGEDLSPLAFHFSPERVEALELRIFDGNEAPLPLSEVSGKTTLPVIYLPAPAGEYFLLLGNPEDRSPIYDLARAEEVIFSVPAEEAEVGPLQENPLFKRGAKLLTPQGKQQIYLWAILLVAVVGLGFWSLKMARKGI